MRSSYLQGIARPVIGDLETKEIVNRSLRDWILRRDRNASACFDRVVFEVDLLFQQLHRSHARWHTIVHEHRYGKVPFAERLGNMG